MEAQRLTQSLVTNHQSLLLKGILWQNHPIRVVLFFPVPLYEVYSMLTKPEILLRLLILTE